MVETEVNYSFQRKRLLQIEKQLSGVNAPSPGVSVRPRLSVKETEPMSHLCLHAPIGTNGMADYVTYTLLPISTASGPIRHHKYFIISHLF